MAKFTRKAKPKKGSANVTRLKKSKSPAKRATPRKATRSARGAKESLGRPKVTGEEMLYMLFKEDYHARQIFDFLRVQTVKDLEQFSPQQIIKRLSQPISETVKRIRQKLAQKNRFLADDIEFAREVKSQGE